MKFTDVCGGVFCLLIMGCVDLAFGETCQAYVEL